MSSMPVNASIALQPGALFDERYRVVRSLNAGGMGAVYEVVDERTDSPRALKVMLPSLVSDPDLRARFALEAKVTGNIASDHIVRVSDAGVEAAGTPYLVMELLQGEELSSLVRRRGPLPPAEVVLYLHQTALALDKTHAAGIVHRDLKLENLFVTSRDDGSPCVKILDFGIAKIVAQGTAGTTQAVGTPIYMAPEQIRGEGAIGHRADLFALGHIAYACLAGEPYWSEEAKAAPSVFTLLGRMVGGLPEPPAARSLRRRGVALPLAFDDWMQRAVAIREDDRFDRATDQIAALAQALGGTSAAAASPVGPPGGPLLPPPVPVWAGPPTPAVLLPAASAPVPTSPPSPGLGGGTQHSCRHAAGDGERRRARALRGGVAGGAGRRRAGRAGRRGVAGGALGRNGRSRWGRLPNPRRGRRSRWGRKPAAADRPATGRSVLARDPAHRGTERLRLGLCSGRVGHRDPVGEGSAVGQGHAAAASPRSRGAAADHLPAMMEW